MPIPDDYEERVYAGVLGKIIGVYLGRPFEGWLFPEIMEKLGEIWYYVHDKLNRPLIVTDDDISGTFTFLRALPDYGNSLDLTPEQVGQTWLNYIIENKTILWWGGFGNSTEHTAFLRLKEGIRAPLSGSCTLNGKVVSEQIGAQIFIDGWAMVAPGNPELAADLARRAASVSHDGEAIYGAQVIAAMEAQAFMEADLNRLLDIAAGMIPRDSVIYRMIADVREWHTQEPDWRKAFQLLAENYGYDQYGGNCHMVPNHGLIVLSLLYGEDNFQKTQMIVNTCGWDTDCNAGNVGCLLGIKNGLAGIEAGPDWRGPVADRLYLPTADGGRAITDAVTETYQIVNIGRALAGKPPVAPKDGARFHFEMPGSVQGFRPEDGLSSGGTVRVENVPGYSQKGTRSLAIRYEHVAKGCPVRVATATFLSPEAARMPGYSLIASPTLYSGQRVKAAIQADQDNRIPVSCRLYLRVYDSEDKLVYQYGPEAALGPGQSHTFAWQIEDTGGLPIAEIGLEIRSDMRADGAVYLDYLTWEGSPNVNLIPSPARGEMWRRAWVNGMKGEFSSWQEPCRLVQNEGTGLIIQGTREWRDYRVSADISLHLAKSGGVAACVQGMQRYYALLLCDDRRVRLVKIYDGTSILAEKEFDWQFGETHELVLEVAGACLQGWVDGISFFTIVDEQAPLISGAVGLVCERGRTASRAVRVESV